MTNDKLPGGTGKFAAKLTFEERCGFYFAHIMGVDRELISIASGLHRSTVTRLTNRNYSAYAEIHWKLDELGIDVFRERYYTEDIQERLARAQRQVAARRLVVHEAAGPVQDGPARLPGGQVPDYTPQPPVSVHRGDK